MRETWRNTLRLARSLGHPNAIIAPSEWDSVIRATSADPHKDRVQLGGMTMVSGRTVAAWMDTIFAPSDMPTSYLWRGEPTDEIGTLRHVTGACEE